MKETELLFDLLKKGVSPVQAVRACKERLESAGFLELPYDEPWKLQKNGRYYVNHHDTTLFAFTVGEGWQESGKIFTQYNGLTIHPSSVTSWLRKFTESNGLPHVTSHMLRHTSATMLLMQGVPLKAVSKRLGHTLASTTSDIYGHSLRSVEDIAADKLEAMLSPSSQLKKEDE